MTRSNRLFAGLWLLLVVGCGAPPIDKHLEAAREEMRQANYRLAYAELQAALAEHPDDAELQRRVREARILYLLDLQRHYVFEQRETEALAILARVLTLDPENAVALSWQTKAKESLGARLVVEGQESLASGRLEEAQQKLQLALDYVPGNERALAGLRDVAEYYRTQRERAAQHYRSAVLARDQEAWQRVEYHARTSIEIDPAHPDAPQLHEVAGRKVADQQLAWAEQQAKAQNWAAAARGYKLAAESASEGKLPWAQSARQKAETCAKEAEAIQLMARAEGRIAATNFADARRLLDDADELTTQERSELADLRRFLEQEERRWSYETAHLQEVDHKYEEALDSYRKLAELDPAGRAAGRVRVLEERLAQCAELYAQVEAALAAGAQEKAIGLLRELTANHPRYRDARQRLLALTAAAREGK